MSFCKGKISVQFIFVVVPNQESGIHFATIGLWQAYTFGDDFGKC